MAATSSSGISGRMQVKLLDHINVPFAASLVLHDNYAEVLLCLYFASSDAMPQAAVSVSLRYPYAAISLRNAKEADAGEVLLLGEGSKLFEKLVPALQLPVVAQPSDAHPQVAGAQEEDGFLSLVLGEVADDDDKLAAAAMLEAANNGINHRTPELVAEGEGGTYFVYDETGDIVGVFKPTDEDPQGDNNPKKRKDSSASASSDDSCEKQQRTRQSIPANETAVREAAAYAIDRGYAGVPPTFLVRARHPSFGNGEEAKLGSFQQFAVNECASWDVGPASFSVEDVHRIGMFDIRTFNTDRHGGNMLCRRAEQPQGKVQYDLVPIDHAYCFPTALGEANWEWLYWPQAKVPFTQDELRYIEAIDIEADLKLLSDMGLTQEALNVYRITSTFLKKGAAAGLTLYEMGKLCYRGRNDSVSLLEAACAALDLTLPMTESGPNTNQLECALEALCKSGHCSIACNNNRAPSPMSRG